MGAVTVLVGLFVVVVGMMLGVRKVLHEPQLHADWESASMKLLGEILKAPRDKAYFVGGIFLVVLGVILLLAG